MDRDQGETGPTADAATESHERLVKELLVERYRVLPRLAVPPASGDLGRPVAPTESRWYR